LLVKKRPRVIPDPVLRQCSSSPVLVLSMLTLPPDTTPLSWGWSVPLSIRTELSSTYISYLLCHTCYRSSSSSFSRTDSRTVGVQLSFFSSDQRSAHTACTVVQSRTTAPFFCNTVPSLGSCDTSIYKFHHQLFARCFYIYYTHLLLVSALYPGHLQGVTSSVDVYGICGSL